MSKIFRRSLYISADLKSGDRLSARNMRIIRPGFGLQPKYYDIVIGKCVNRDVSAGTPVSWELIS
jgi:N-acetylneuraminate synthase